MTVDRSDSSSVIKPDFLHRAAGQHVRVAASVRVDLEQATNSMAGLLRSLNVDLERDGMRETPMRAAKAMAELLTPRPFELTTFANEYNYDEMVVARDVPFCSMCEHHALPFFGRAHVAYVPDTRVVGLSKLARVVQFFARGLQVQERLTAQVADFLQEKLSPKGVGVIIEAEHLCMSIRGVMSPGVTTATSICRGLLRDDPSTRREFLSLTQK